MFKAKDDAEEKRGDWTDSLHLYCNYRRYLTLGIKTAQKSYIM